MTDFNGEKPKKYTQNAVKPQKQQGGNNK